MDIEQKHNSLKRKFVENLSSLLPFSEWNEQLLELCEIKSNFPKGYSSIIFPDGLSEIVDFFEEYYDIKMLESLAVCDLPDKIRDRIHLALRFRINQTDKLIHIKNRQYFTRPVNLMQATKVAFRTCDLIWRYAGDKSLDYNYYTKRSLLMTVYISSIMHFINDTSQDNISTDEYITTALSNIIKLTLFFKSPIPLPNIVNIPIVRLFS